VIAAPAFSPIEKMSDVSIIPSIMHRRDQKWNGGYKLIVRLGATANEKKRSCPRFLIVKIFGVRPQTRNLHMQAVDFDSTIRRFESSRPGQLITLNYSALFCTSFRTSKSTSFRTSVAIWFASA
jgi:hypothetical protein